MMKRREFITLLGGAAAAWPLAARAQKQRLPTVGILGGATAATWSTWTPAFVRRLVELGWIEGRTVAIEYRWAEGRPERAAEMAAELIRLKVDVILTAGGVLAAVKPRRLIRSAPASPRAWRDRAATPPACRCKPLIMPPSVSSFFASSCRRPGDWPFWSTAEIPAPY
jgi:hypothetical protein